MYNDLDNIGFTISELSNSNWEKLFSLIPEIKKTKSFKESGGIVEDVNDTDGFMITPVIEKKIVWDFEKVLDELNLLIAFNWSSWDEGRKIASKGDYRGLDTVTLLKLLSAFIRNNRFCDGALAAKFEDRTIEKILLEIKKNIENKSPLP